MEKDDEENDSSESIEIEPELKTGISTRTKK